MCTNVSLFPDRVRFPVQLTVDGRLGVFAASKADTVQLWSVFRSGRPRLLVADATAAKVRLISKW